MPSCRFGLGWGPHRCLLCPAPAGLALSQAPGPLTWEAHPGTALTLSLPWEQRPPPTTSACVNHGAPSPEMPSRQQGNGASPSPDGLTVSAAHETQVPLLEDTMVTLWSQSLQGFEVPPLCLRGAEMNLCGLAPGNRQMPQGRTGPSRHPRVWLEHVQEAPSARPGEQGWGWDHTRSLQAVGSPPPPNLRCTFQVAKLSPRLDWLPGGSGLPRYQGSTCVLGGLFLQPPGRVLAKQRSPPTPIPATPSGEYAGGRWKGHPTAHPRDPASPAMRCVPGCGPRGPPHPVPTQYAPTGPPVAVGP